MLLVLLHHAEIGPFRAGYLGVDIFFVISGFLITRIVKQAIEDGSFRFADFYFRRAKRLLPAAYVTFLATALVAPLMLDTAELKDFAAQLLGAVTFSGNFVLLGQSGYFEGDAAFKPLLHVWSLAIEEQYYLLLPAAMVFVPPRLWLRGALGIGVLSFGACLLVGSTKPDDAFFLLPFRAWELAIGSIGALASFNAPSAKRILSVLHWPAVVTLLLVPLVPIGATHPGVGALAVCCATLVVILREHPTLNGGRFCGLLAKVGDCSYSLYLAHWPVIAFINNAYVGAAPPTAHLVGLGVGVVLGWLLYRFVETPVRRMPLQPSRELFKAAVSASLGLALLSYGSVWLYALGGTDYGHIRRANRGFEACSYRDGFAVKPECRNADAPKILVWGDSYAMHLVPGLATTTDAGVLQAARSRCAPFLNLVSVDVRNANYDWAARCLAFNAAVVDYLKATPSIEVVVMSSPFDFVLSERTEDRVWRTLSLREGRFVERVPDVGVAVAAMRETVETLRAHGKRVVIVAPPPAPGFDAGACLERKATGKLLLGDRRDCRIPVSHVAERQARVHDFLARVEALGIPVVRFDGVLCSDGYCTSEFNGVFVYRDSGHLSYDGSRVLLEQIDLGRLLLARAD